MEEKFLGSEQRNGVEVSAYRPPSETVDPHQAVNDRLANAVFAVLQKHYFGHGWRVKANAYHGVIAFNIPELMGETLHQIVKLNQYTSDAMIVDLAGNLLERMGLRRGPADLDAVREAKKRMHTFQFGDVKQ